MCDENADCFNTEGSYECTCRPGYSGPGRVCEGKIEDLINIHSYHISMNYMAAGIPPFVTILERPNENPITMTVEPGRPLSLTCESSMEHVGNVTWTLSG